MWSLYLLSGQDSAPLCPCHFCYLKVSTGDRVQLFTLFPVVTSIWRCKQEAGCKCLTWSPSSSCLSSSGCYDSSVSGDGGDGGGGCVAMSMVEVGKPRYVGVFATKDQVVGTAKDYC